MKNSSDTIGNRTRDLPASNTVPQTSAPPRAPRYLYIRTEFRKVLIRISSIRNNVWYDLSLIKLLVASFMDTGGFLIRYPNGHTKLTHRQLKKFRDYFNKILFI
jgi:hypothetical protein